MVNKLFLVGSPTLPLFLTNHISSIGLRDIHPGTISEPAEYNHSDRIKDTDDRDDQSTVRFVELVTFQVLRYEKVWDNEPGEEQHYRDTDQGELGIEIQGEIEDRLQEIHVLVVPFLEKELYIKKRSHSLAHQPPALTSSSSRASVVMEFR